MKIATVAGFASANASGCSGHGHAVSGALRIALFAGAIAASPFASADPPPLCSSSPSGFRQEIVNRLPLKSENDDLTNVLECKEHWKKNGNLQFAACIEGVEKFLRYDARKDIGTDPPEADELHRAKAEFPGELKDRALFEALDNAVLDNHDSLISVRERLDAINTINRTNWVMAWFGGHVPSVTKVQGATSFGRILMYSPEKQTWANFVIGDKDKSVGNADSNVSIIKLADDQTYFQDFTRYTRTMKVDSAGLPGNGERCGQCHASGFLKVYPTDNRSDEAALSTINVQRSRAPFAKQDVSVFNNVIVGNDAPCGDLPGETMNCRSCHNRIGSQTDWRGPLYLDRQSNRLIEFYVVQGGHMPPGNSLTREERSQLYKCLVDDFQKRFREKLVKISCGGK